MGGMNLGPAPIGMGNAMGNIMGGVGGIGGIQNNPLGGIGSIGGLGRGNGADSGLGGSPMDNTGGLLANPVLSGFAPGLQGGGFQGGFQGGLPMGMGGMGTSKAELTFRYQRDVYFQEVYGEYSLYSFPSFQQNHCTDSP